MIFVALSLKEDHSVSKPVSWWSGHVVAAMAGFRYPFHTRRPEPPYKRVLPLIADMEEICNGMEKERKKVSMLLASITTIFLATEKQWMMLDWKIKRTDMLADLDSFGLGRLVEDGFVVMMISDGLLESAGLQTKLLWYTGIVSPGPIFDDALSVFNTSMEIDLLSNPRRIIPLTSLGRSLFLASSRVFAGDIYGEHVVSCAGIIGIKHRHNVLRDTLVDICYRSGISASKEVDIGLDGRRDKPLRPTNMLLYSWDEGLDVCVDLTGSLPLTQTGMVDFIPNRAVIDAAERKRAKYMAKCASIGYGFLPFFFSSLGELEAEAVTLLKRI
uniref:Acyl-ACP-thioesterase N-terminal domain-containing protein n=1 Tax=Tanacetum cinerariifolium TaxID=118510 RepID=A0A6L2JKV2_TANCI|nr:hypothetical protein [Tanacetum cinerariifolium]